MNSGEQADIVVIGGGLAGMTATLRLASSGKDIVVIDDSLPDAAGRIGGFARFSGAKFSLPPAGMGLLPIAGSEQRLLSTINSVLQLLGLDGAVAQTSVDKPVNAGMAFRLYQSILLSPNEINTLLDNLSRKVHASSQIVFGKAVNIEKCESGWMVDIICNQGTRSISCMAIFYAAGRLSDRILLTAGAKPTEGKGLDVGVRLEFNDKAALSALRQYGPDAKVISGACRTFCLNSPGTIYRYRSEGFSIPGGVVAEPDTQHGNVGILLRLAGKKAALERVRNFACANEHEILTASSQWQSGKMLATPLLTALYGTHAAQSLSAFVNHLGDSNLVDLQAKYRIHLPLVDWHWNTFAIDGSHQTSLPGMYAIGDSSGHARGLLQACMSGWLAAEEYLC